MSRLQTEVCSHIVRDHFGHDSINARIFICFVQRGRCSSAYLRRKTGLSAAIIKESLLILIQRRLVLFYDPDSARPNTVTLYEPNVKAVYSLSRAGKVAKVGAERFGTTGAKFFTRVQCLGHATATTALEFEEAEAPPGSKDTAKHLTFAARHGVSTGFSESGRHSKETERTIDKILAAQFVVRCQPEDLTPLNDLYEKYKVDVIRDVFDGDYASSKAKEKASTLKYLPWKRILSQQNNNSVAVIDSRAGSDVDRSSRSRTNGRSRSAKASSTNVEDTKEEVHQEGENKANTEIREHKIGVVNGTNARKQNNTMGLDGADDEDDDEPVLSASKRKLRYVTSLDGVDEDRTGNADPAPKRKKTKAAGNSIIENAADNINDPPPRRSTRGATKKTGISSSEMEPSTNVEVPTTTAEGQMTKNATKLGQKKNTRIPAEEGLPDGQKATTTMESVRTTSNKNAGLKSASVEDRVQSNQEEDDSDKADDNKKGKGADPTESRKKSTRDKNHNEPDRKVNGLELKSNGEATHHEDHKLAKSAKEARFASSHSANGIERMEDVKESTQNNQGTLKEAVGGKLSANGKATKITTTKENAPLQRVGRAEPTRKKEINDESKGSGAIVNDGRLYIDRDGVWLDGEELSFDTPPVPLSPSHAAPGSFAELMDTTITGEDAFEINPLLGMSKCVLGIGPIDELPSNVQRLQNSNKRRIDSKNGPGRLTPVSNNSGVKRSKLKHTENEWRVRLDYDKVDVAMRSDCAEVFATARLGDTTAKVFAALARCTEKLTRRCFEREEALFVHTFEESKRRHVEEDRDKKKKRVDNPVVLKEIHNPLEVPVGRTPTQTWNPRITTEEIGEELGQHVKVATFSATNPTIKEEGQDDVPGGPDKEKRRRLEYIEQHLMVLEEDPCNFAQRVDTGPNGFGIWQIEFHSLVRLMLQNEIYKSATHRLGTLASRIIRLLEGEGSLQLKKVAQITMSPRQDVELSLGLLMEYGYVNNTLWPTESARKAENSDFTVHYDFEACRQNMVTDSWQMMSRMYQRLSHERSKLEVLLDRAEDPKVVGQEHLWFNPRQLNRLEAWKKTEAQLLIQIGRIDEMIMLSRDFFPPGQQLDH